MAENNRRTLKDSLIGIAVVAIVSFLCRVFLKDNINPDYYVPTTALLVVLSVILTEKFLLNHKNTDGNTNRD